jgi:hypothetical protein
MRLWAGCAAATARPEHPPRTSWGDRPLVHLRPDGTSIHIVPATLRVSLTSPRDRIPPERSSRRVARRRSLRRRSIHGLEQGRRRVKRTGRPCHINVVCTPGRPLSPGSQIGALVGCWPNLHHERFGVAAARPAEARLGLASGASRSGLVSRVVPLLEAVSLSGIRRRVGAAAECGGEGGGAFGRWAGVWIMHRPLGTISGLSHPETAQRPGMTAPRRMPVGNCIARRLHQRRARTTMQAIATISRAGMSHTRLASPICPSP